MSMLFGLSLCHALPAFTLTSSDFFQDTPIPEIFTCDSQNISPPLSWHNSPKGTKSFVLIMDDPDAPGGTWNHWIMFNIPASVSKLKAGFSNPPDGARPARNSWGNLSYGGPCPPSGAHHYHLKLYALDSILSLGSAPTKFQVEHAMGGHILAKAELRTIYKKLIIRK